MIAGHMIAVMVGRRPKTYMVCEGEAGAAMECLRKRLGMPLDVPLSPLPVSRAVMADHDLQPGHIKQLHL